MYRFRIIAVGKIKESWWREALGEYLKRLGPFAKVEMVEVAAEPLTDTVTAEEAMRREGVRLLAALKPDSVSVALDRLGTKVSSEKLAAFVADVGGNGQPVDFVIGGAAGLHSTVLARANRKVSFSDLTLTHEMARVLLLEQLYRAMTILSGKKYHL